MDALGLAFSLFAIAFLLIPVGMLALRMVQRVIRARTLRAMWPVDGEVSTTAAYVGLQAVAIGLGVWAFYAIGLVGVPALVVYFAVRLGTLQNYVIAPGNLCFACKYPMAGLDTDRCPECGAAFRPADRIAL